MGMSVSVATAIIFIAAVISAAALIGTFDEVQTTWTDVRRDSLDRDMTASHTDIAIVSIDRENGTVEVVNKGQSTLRLGTLDVLLDGNWSNGQVISMEIVGHADSRIWLPGDVLTIRFSSDLADKNIKIVTGNGISVND